MQLNIRLWGQQAEFAAQQVLLYFQPIIETYAKQNAPWTDRTANARQSLHADVEVIAGQAVILYLSHGVSYGIYLEVAFAGRYAIIWPTIEAHLPQVAKMLQEIFS
ncbi:MAG: hypothetical protein JNJ61_10775 [Anaerolineae bacterium]|nr:hypothetical protein [Anaerolineae bacterium]